MYSSWAHHWDCVHNAHSIKILLNTPYIFSFPLHLSLTDASWFWLPNKIFPLKSLSQDLFLETQAKTVGWTGSGPRKQTHKWDFWVWPEGNKDTLLVVSEVVKTPCVLEHYRLSAMGIEMAYWLQQTGKLLRRWEYQTTWPASWEICMQVKKQQLELDMEQWTGSISGK